MSMTLLGQRSPSLSTLKADDTAIVGDRHDRREPQPQSAIR
jgi:hypothetical protein